MKIYISIDMEGITTTAFWNDTISGKSDYYQHAIQLNKELVAACKGAIKAGATEIIVNDAHDLGNNVNQDVLPKGVKVIRGFSGHPYSMVDGLDSTFDGCVFIGYHSGASKAGNTLSHTESTKPFYVKLNDRVVGEFDLYAYACIKEGVPILFLSGDKEMCEEAKEVFPSLTVCAVKEAKGASTINYNVKEVLEEIELKVEESVKNIKNIKNPPLPSQFELEVCYKNPARAEKNSYYPGIERINSNTIKYKNKDYFEILRTFSFIYQ